MAGDSSWKSVALLLHGDGVDGSTALLDSGPGARVLTNNGSVVLSKTQAKFGPSSIYFNGASFATVPMAPLLQLGANNYTVEAHVYLLGTPAGGSYYALGSSTVDGSGTGWRALIDSSRKLSCMSAYWSSGGPVAVTNPSATIPLNTWTHVCWQRIGNDLYHYVDGVLDSHYTIGAGVYVKDSTNATFDIGRNTTNVWLMNGYVDEFRITNGAARYPAAGFTPPSAAFPNGAGQVTGTVKGGDGNPAARMVRAYRRDTGALVASQFTAAGDPSYPCVTLMLHADEIGSTSPTDSSMNPHTVTAAGGAKISSAQPWMGKGAMKFNGAGDYFYCADSPDFEPGAGDFTIECGVFITGYSASSGGDYGAVVFGKDTNNDRGYNLAVTGTANSYTGLKFQGFAADGSSTTVQANYAFALNTEYHVAVSRIGNMVYLFVNGTCINPGGTAFAKTIKHTSSPFKIGALYFDGGATYNYYLPGYIDELRFTKSVGRYSGDFAVQTTRFPDRTTGALGEINFYTPTLDEIHILCLDDDAGTVEEDKVLRFFPA